MNPQPKPAKRQPKARKPLPRSTRRIRVRRPAGTVRREAKAAGYVDPDSWLAVIEFYCGRCAYCDGRPLVMTQDHVVPLSNGGKHHISNVVPACGCCNYRKGQQTWIPRRLHPWMARED